MAKFEEFCSQLLEESKRFWEKSQETKDRHERDACLHAALLLCSSALEAHLNSISSELLLGPKLDITDLSILNEKEIALSGGEFLLVGQKYFRVIDRIEYLVVKFSGKKIDKKAQWWSDIQAAIHLRNELTHPRGESKFDADSVKRALIAMIETINIVYISVYKTKLPVYDTGLISKLDF